MHKSCGHVLSNGKWCFLLLAVVRPAVFSDLLIHGFSLAIIISITDSNVNHIITFHSKLSLARTGVQEELLTIFNLTLAELVQLTTIAQTKKLIYVKDMGAYDPP